MAKALIKQADAKRLFNAAREAGGEAARITLHPDGRIEAVATFSEAMPITASGEANSWDAPLKAQGL